jgi:adenylosuccinate synthase
MRGKGAVVVGTQWGDEGKGTYVDLISGEYDAAFRFQGGDNAGHTVVVDGKTYKLQLIPSGIIAAQRNFCCNGMVINPRTILNEIKGLRERGVKVSPDNLMISNMATPIFPYHVAMDAAKEIDRGKESIGTTKRGIGPAYADKTSRDAIVFGDFVDRDVFPDRLRKSFEDHKKTIEGKYEQPFDLDFDEILAEFEEHADELRPFVGDTRAELNRLLREGKNLVAETAQSTYLSKDQGTYPYVTSSNSIAAEVSAGAGIGPINLGHILGVVKAFTTRVGNGAFPTELGSDTDPRFLAEIRSDVERYTKEDIKRFLQSIDLYEVGLGLRLLTGEYGTVTERPRRTGYLDGVMVRTAADINSLTSLIVTKMDGFGGLSPLKIAKSYRKRAPDGSIVEMDYFPHNPRDLLGCEPVYEEFEPIPDLTPEEWRNYGNDRDKLPEPVQRYLSGMEDIIGVPVSMASFGPDRIDKKIFYKDF